MGSENLNLNVLSARSLNLFILCVCVTFSGEILLGNYSPEIRY